MAERSGTSTERHETVIIGAGQSGLATGYHLARMGRPFVIVDANERVGDTWRRRWDSLRLFTPARFNSLPGMRFPAPRHSFPTKDEMADYLEAYAERYALPVRTGVRVDRLSRNSGKFTLETNTGALEADNVVVAMATYQKPRIPAFANELAPNIVQLHSRDYKHPSQLQEGGVLVVGAGNSGAEIARELAPLHPTWVSGRSTGEIPFRVDSFLGLRLLVPLTIRVVFHRVLTTRTPIGRKARPTFKSKGGPLIRTKSKHLASVGVQRVGRTIGVQAGLPVMEGGEVLNIANVIWCTGYHAGFSWIDLPVFDEEGEPVHNRGIVASEPGLYFQGLEFLYSASSVMVHAAGRDGGWIARDIQARALAATRAQEGRAAPVTQS
jgi:putative flavoprotein involved in K+ transport